MLFILIGGASASGKSHIARLLLEHLEKQGIKTEMLSMDNFYKRKSDLGIDNPNFDQLGVQAIDLNLYHAVLKQFAERQIVQIPLYSFAENDRLAETQSIDAAPLQAVIIEGIYALYNIPQHQEATTLSYFIRADSYLSYQQQRIIRDGKERNRTPEEVLKREKRTFGVRDAFFSTILPTIANADYCITNNPTKQLETVVQEMLDPIMDIFHKNSSKALP